MEGQVRHFKLVKRTFAKNRRLHTVPTYDNDNEYSDPKYEPLILNPRYEDYSNYSYTKPIIHVQRQLNKQSTDINQAVLERKIEEGTYNNDINYDFIKKVKEKRESTIMSEGKPMTQQELANLCNLPIGIIRDFEAGKYKLKGQEVTKVKRALDI